jgi:nucleotide-binding universal stress UspA family protein
MSPTRERLRPIIAAVRIDRSPSPVMRAALWLAKRRHLPVRMTYVFNPATPGAITQFAAVRARLEEKAKTYSLTGVSITVDALLADYPTGLWEHAAEVDAALIVVGAHGGSSGFLNTNLRPVFQLLAHAAMPVLVLPDLTPRPRRRERPLRVLLADEMSAGTTPVIAAATRLVEALELPIELMHLHVAAVPAVGFALSPDYQLDVWPGLSVSERLVSDHHEHLKQTMRTRAVALERALRTAGGQYRAELWHGHVADEIARAVQTLEPDITVFGRHQLIHRKPLALGQMPFDAMLKLNGAILVAPQA